MKAEFKQKNNKWYHDDDERIELKMLIEQVVCNPAQKNNSDLRLIIILIQLHRQHTFKFIRHESGILCL